MKSMLVDRLVDGVWGIIRRGECLGKVVNVRHDGEVTE